MVQVSYHFINITDELLKASNEALNAWAMAVRADDSGVLKAPLANVCNLMVDVSLGRFMVFLEIPSDDLEPRAGRAFMEVDKLLRQQASAEDPPLQLAALMALKLLHRHSVGVLTLACGRFLSQTVMHRRGIPPELKARLEAALGLGDLKEHEELWSRFGNSKFHVWTADAKFNRRKHLHGRGGRKSRQRQSDAAEEDPAGSADPSDSAGLADSDPATRRPRIADAHALAEPSQASGWPPIVIAGPAYVSLPSWL